jgi:hypothetical protein
VRVLTVAIEDKLTRHYQADCLPEGHPIRLAIDELRAFRRISVSALAIDAARYLALRDLACEQPGFLHDGTPWCCYMHEDEDGRLDLSPASGLQLDRLVDALIARTANAGEVKA